MGAAEPAVGELRDRAQRALRRRWAGASLGEPVALPGGISSLTFCASLHGAGDDRARAVIKVAPPGLAPVRNRDVLRQARVLSALHGRSGVLVPEVLATDDGTPPLFVMEMLGGEAYEPKWDLRDDPPAAPVVAQRARAAARLLAALQAVDVADAGLGGEPVLSPSAELERWAALYATVGQDLRGEGEQRLRKALGGSAPAAAERPVIAHGDYRLGNILFDGERPTGIIDWEIWSVGDPRTDLAWLLMYCDPVAQRVSERDPANRAAADAMPAASELLSEFAEAVGTDAACGAPPRADLDWFRALCHYKLGAAMAVLAKRNRRLAEPDPGLELAVATTPPMLARGLQLLG